MIQVQLQKFRVKVKRTTFRGQPFVRYGSWEWKDLKITELRFNDVIGGEKRQLVDLRGSAIRSKSCSLLAMI